MKVPTAILALVGYALAYPDYDDWKAPTEGDLRGPCPALNALANHGASRVISLQNNCSIMPKLLV